MTAAVLCLAFLLPAAPLPAPRPPVARAMDQDLAKDLSGWPSHEECVAQRRFARLHLEWVEGQCSLSASNSRAFFRWGVEAKHRWDAWDDLTRATSPRECEGSRRVYLDTLRQKIGDNDFEARRMPCLPLWRFRRVD